MELVSGIRHVNITSPWFQVVDNQKKDTWNKYDSRNNSNLMKRNGTVRGSGQFRLKDSSLVDS